MMRILLIEDNKALCQNMAHSITSAGYELDYTYDGKEGLTSIESHAYDLIILDCMLPSLSGIELLKIIRPKGIHTPVIMITALSDVSDRINGLDSGADDYLTKPFDMEELLARIRALRRRPHKWESATQLSFGDLRYDSLKQILESPTKNCSLTKREGTLLELFLENPNQILPRQVILSRIWGPDAPVEESNIDNFIFFIRRRLKNLESRVQLTTIRSVGYILEEKDAR